MQSMKIQMAPDRLWQSIMPWSFYAQGNHFALFDINLGATPRPEVERAVLDEVGSYGRQLGHVGEALKVLLARLDRTSLSPSEADAIAILEGDLAQVRAIKARPPSADA